MDAPIELVDIYPTIIDIVGMKTPEFISGKSFAPLLKDSKARVRTSALTELGVFTGRNPKVQGYSIKTDRYRLTQWGEKGLMGHELYDHRFDKKELNNLADKIEYKSIKDSLIEVIVRRIADARKKPKGLGPQIAGTIEWGEPKSIHSKPK